MLLFRFTLTWQWMNGLKEMEYAQQQIVSVIEEHPYTVVNTLRVAYRPLPNKSEISVGDAN